MGKKTFKRKLNPNQQQTKLYDKITYVETKILTRINNVKRQKNSFNMCDHYQKSHTMQCINENEFDSAINYYDKFWKQYMMTIAFYKRLQQYENHVQSLQNNIHQIQRKFNQRQVILDMPALSKIKRPISRHSIIKQKQNGQKQQLLQRQQLNLQKQQVINNNSNNNIIQLKKQQEIQPQLINYQSQDNHIFYQ